LLATVLHVFNLVFTTMNCIGFIIIMFVILVYYFSSFFSIFMSVIILCVPFVANKRVH